MSKLIGENVLMRIFIGEGDRYEHQPLFAALVELFRQEGFAGATVLRGLCGFGANRVFHSQRLLDLSADLPLIVEVVDTEAKINAIMPRIDAMMGGWYDYAGEGDGDSLHSGSGTVTKGAACCAPTWS